MGGQITDIDGNPVNSAQVTLYQHIGYDFDFFRPTVAMVTYTQTTNTGEYHFHNLGQGIEYQIFVQDTEGKAAPEYSDPITITLGQTRTVDVQLNVPQPPLATVNVGSANATTSTNSLNGQVSVNLPAGSATDITITYAVACTESATVTLTYNNQSYTMTAVGGGNYEATIPASDVTADGDISVNVMCGSTEINTVVGGVTLFDPSGIITDLVTNQPVVGAEVTLYRVPDWEPRTSADDTRPQTCESNNSKPADQDWSQPAPTELGLIVNTDQTIVSPLVNQQITNDVGYYGWDVPEGCWYVRVEAEGYETLVSPVVGVPPEVTDLDLALTPNVPTYTLSVNVEGSGTVTPTRGTYLSGTVVSLSAMPDEGWQFDSWRGDVTDNGSTVLPLLMDANKVITATFTELITPTPSVSYTLSVSVEGSGTVTPTTGTYLSGTVVSLSAMPDEGWQFAGWSGDVTDNGSTVLPLLMDANKAITATFIEEAMNEIYLPLVLK
jgi:hypothetical protein